MGIELVYLTFCKSEIGSEPTNIGKYWDNDEQWLLKRCCLMIGLGTLIIHELRTLFLTNQYGGLTESLEHCSFGWHNSRVDEASEKRQPKNCELTNEKANHGEFEQPNNKQSGVL